MTDTDDLEAAVADVINDLAEYEQKYRDPGTHPEAQALRRTRKKLERAVEEQDA